jgi:hypothetical protein
MNMRKIAVVGGFAVGAALASAPIASADNLTSIVDTEISSLNALFTVDTDLAGVSGDVTAPTATNPFDIITPADIATVQGSGATAGTTPFDFLTYGLDPSAAGLASDPGSYNVLNGAVVEFDDAANVELYALENNGALMPDSVAAADLIGSSTNIDNALDTGNATGAAEYFFNFGLGDLQGYFDTSSLTGASTLSDLGSGLDLTSLLDPGSLGDGLTGLLGDLGSLGGSLF